MAELHRIFCVTCMLPVMCTLCTTGFVDDTSVFIPWDQWAESSMTLCLEEVRQVAVPVGHQTTTVSGRVHQNAAPAAKSDIYG